MTGRRAAGPHRSAVRDRDELVPLVAALLGLLEHRADAPDVELVVDDARLERRPLLREQHLRGSMRADGAEERDALVVVLPAGLADARVRRHVDARLRAVHARLPGALGAGDAAVPVELSRVLAEVPDVALGVLAVPVRRALLEAAAYVEPVAHGGAGDSVDRLRPVENSDHVTGTLAVLDP